MDYSDGMSEIAAALHGVQSEVEDPPRGGENPHYGSRYVTLEDLIHKVRPVLSAHDISLVQAPGLENGHVTVETMLLHTSGEWVRHTARTPLQRDDPQGVGSAITYLRRYSLASMLGVASEEDDDAERAVQRDTDGGRARKASGQKPERSGDGSGPTCPECGDDVWDNTDDPDKSDWPAFKCKDKECGWKVWEPEDAPFYGQTEPREDDGLPPGSEEYHAKRKRLKSRVWDEVGSYITAEDMRLKYLKAYATDHADRPDDLVDWEPEHFEATLEHIEDVGMEALAHLEPEMGESDE